MHNIQFKLNNFIAQINNQIKAHPFATTSTGVLILSLISYGYTFAFNFWRDDWGLLWRTHYELYEYLKLMPQFRHPGEFLSTVPWFYFLGTSVFAWSLYGLLLRIIVSFAAGLASYGITQNRKAFYIGALFYASYFGGLEAYTWISARFVAFIVLGIALAIYFYANNFKKFTRGYWYAAVIMAVVLLIEPARGIFLPVMLLMWEGAKRFTDNELFSKKYAYNIVILIGLTLLILSATTSGSSLKSPTTTIQYSKHLQESYSKIDHYFHSLGNLVIPYIQPTHEQLGLAALDKQKALVSPVLLIMGLVGGFITTLRKKKYGPTILLSCVWIPLFFLPGWISDVDVNAGAVHRHLAISSLAIVFLFVTLIIKLPTKYSYGVLICILTLNLYRSVEILKNDYPLRGYGVTQPLYKTMIRDVPKGEKQSVFIVNGNPSLRGSAFDFAAGGTLPFAVLTKIGNRNEIPIPVPNYKLVADLICKENVQRPYFDGWNVQKNKVPIEKIYSWQLTDTATMKNDTDEKRVIIVHLAECISQKVAQPITPDISLESTVMLENLYDKDKRAISFKWNVTSKEITRVEINTKLLDASAREITKQTLIMEPGKSQEENYITTFWEEKKYEKPKSALLQINICKLRCEAQPSITIHLGTPYE